MPAPSTRLTALPSSPFGVQTEGFDVQAIPPGPVRMHLVPHKHLLYVNIEEGASVQEVSSDRARESICEQDTFALYPAGTDFRLSAENTGWGVALEIDPERLESLVREALTDQMGALEPVMCTPEAQAAAFARTLRQHLRGPSINPLVAEGLSLLIVGLALEKALNGFSTSVSVAGTDDRIARAIEYAETYMRDPISVAKLADVACMSPWHFSRCFSEAVGEPPYRWIQRRRAERAVELIRYSTLSFAFIAGKCGFFDQSGMGAAVKSLTGLTPSKLRTK
ncbi:helix-turn-helix domain-containing protein [Aestuariibius sp. 2305UL40-4]|uniref:helix-turn-helix domain-containing protein n=1 Tax=Aestuariibius violaceus TaxID=3234132 RepID=UPI00345E3E5C